MNNIKRKNSLIVFTIIYTALLIYGTLYPLTAIEFIPVNWSLAFENFLSATSSKSDLLTNAIIYLPFGFLLFRTLYFDKPKKVGIGAVFLFGFLLSASLEFTQLYLAHRTTSLVDLSLNSLGAFLGAIIAFNVTASSSLGKHLIGWKKTLFIEHYATSLGLLVILFWSFSQLMPLVPAISWSFIKESIKPMLHTMIGERPLDYFKFIYYIFSFSSIGLILSIMLKKHHSTPLIFFFFIVFILTSKIVVIDRQLSFEALCAAFLSILIIAITENSTIKKRVLFGLFFILTSLLANELAPVLGRNLNSFAWIPFVSQMKDVMGMLDLVIGMWPYMCIAFFLSIYSQSQKMMFLGGFAILMLSIFLEFSQTNIAGRYPDMTDIIMAMSGWILYFYVLITLQNNKKQKNTQT